MLSTLRHSSCSQVVPRRKRSPVISESVEVHEVNVQDTHVEVTYSREPGSQQSLHAFISHDDFEAMLVADKWVHIRFVKTSVGAWHWGSALTATPTQVTQGYTDLCCFVGPVESYRRGREHLMPISCLATNPSYALVPGEIGTLHELLARDFFGAWVVPAQLLSSVFARAPTAPPVGPRDAPRDEEDLCVVCMDAAPLYAWRGCDHHRALLCETCGDLTMTRAPPPTAQVPCVFCRKPSDLIAYPLPVL